MKKILFIFAIFIGFVVFAGLFISYPFRWFENGLNQYSFEGEWFHLPPFSKTIIQAGTYKAKIGRIESEVFFDPQKWRKMHILDYEVPMPYRHPLIRFIPKLKLINNRESEIGYLLKSINNDLLLEVTFEGSSEFSYRVEDQKIFDLPVIRNQLLKTPKDRLWKDIFGKKIEIKKLSFGDLVYNLYILNWRAKEFTKSTINFYTESSRTIGILDLKSSMADVKEELILVLHQGAVYKFHLKSLVGSVESTLVRQKLIDELEIYPTNESEGELIYKEFSELDIPGKVSDEGLIYLFSAWTHSQNNAGIMHEMVTYAEKGRKKYDVLIILYTYALDKFKKTFSSKIDDIDGESPALKLQRLIEREKVIQDNEVKNREIRPNVELNENEIIHEKLERSKSKQDTDYGRAEE